MKPWMGLTFIYLFILALRLFAAFQTPNLTNDTSYLHLRSIHALQQGQPLTHDPLGYGGREIHQSPFFDIIITLFTFLFPEPIALKAIPNILASLTIIPVYFLTFTLTKHKKASLFASLLSGFLPAYFSSTFNHLTPDAFAITLYFTLAALWVRLPTYAPVYVGISTSFAFLDPLSLLFALTLLVYLFLTLLEKKSIAPYEYEPAIYTIFLTVWAHFLLYKKLILHHGPLVVWQNVPSELFTAYYTPTTMLASLWNIGLLTLPIGVYSFYLTTKKTFQPLQLLLSIAITTTLLLWFQLVTLPIGLSLLGITLCILVAYSLLRFNAFISQTKFSTYKTHVISFSVLAILLSTLTPTYFAVQDTLNKTITPEEVEALKWLNSNSSPYDIILAPPNFGHYITALAGRANVIDTYFILQDDIDQRYKDVNRLYTTSLETEAVDLFDKYYATHIILPTNKQKLSFSDSPCFSLIYNSTIKIYKKNPQCVLRVIA